MREYNFDGLVGPTHNYGGLSFGNVASAKHGGAPSNPREAALQGLAKMRFVAGLGACQAVLPPQPRPSFRTLRALGFSGSDEEVLARASAESEHLLRLVSSAAAMWTANAATVAPSSDARDGKVHFTPANLGAMFHRAIEADMTHAVLQAIFSDRQHFEVHSPLPGTPDWNDEGAANHTRLELPGRSAIHLFGWGRSAYRPLRAPTHYPARQTLEASEAIARLHRLNTERCLFPQQSPEGIDAGAFHSDVLCVGSGGFLMLHTLAFVDVAHLLTTLREKLGPDFRYALASSAELPGANAIGAYPFNSQLLSLSDDSLVLLAPTDAQEDGPSRAFLERVLAEDNPVRQLHYLDVRQSMRNGGGPACLRLRVWLSDKERSTIQARVFWNPKLEASLTEWVQRHYRDRLLPDDLRDPQLARESLTALDELTQHLALGSVYDFQQSA